MGTVRLVAAQNYIAGLNSPLRYPLSTLMNTFAGYLICIVLFMGVYYGNLWRSLNFPFLSQLMFQGSSNSTNFIEYDLGAILNADNTINKTLVAQQGTPSLSGTNVVYLLTTNIGITAAIGHMLLFNFDELKDGWSFLRPSQFRKLGQASTYKFWHRKSEDEQEADRRKIIANLDMDPHYKLMM
jgi:hypothetical protein